TLWREVDGGGVSGALASRRRQGAKRCESRCECRRAATHCRRSRQRSRLRDRLCNVRAARGGRAVRRDRCVLELLAAIVWPRRARDEVSGCYTKFTSIAA